MLSASVKSWAASCKRPAAGVPRLEQLALSSGDAVEDGAKLLSHLKCARMEFDCLETFSTAKCELAEVVEGAADAFSVADRLAQAQCLLKRRPGIVIVGIAQDHSEVVDASRHARTACRAPECFPHSICQRLIERAETPPPPRCHGRAFAGRAQRLLKLHGWPTMSPRCSYTSSADGVAPLCVCRRPCSRCTVGGLVEEEREEP